MRCFLECGDSSPLFDARCVLSAQGSTRTPIKGPRAGSSGGQAVRPHRQSGDKSHFPTSIPMMTVGSIYQAAGSRPPLRGHFQFQGGQGGMFESSLIERNQARLRTELCRLTARLTSRLITHQAMCLIRGVTRLSCRAIPLRNSGVTSSFSPPRCWNFSALAILPVLVFTHSPV